VACVALPGAGWVGAVLSARVDAEVDTGEGVDDDPESGDPHPATSTSAPQQTMTCQ